MNHYTTQLQIEISATPLYKPETDWIAYVEEGWSELASLDQLIEVPIRQLGTFRMNIERIEIPARDYYGRSLQTDRLLFRLAVPYDDRYVDWMAPKSGFDDEAERIPFAALEIANEFSYFLHHFLILTHIARPGAIKAKAGKVIIDGRFGASFPALISMHRSVLPDAVEWAHPKLDKLKILDVWNWHQSHGFSFYRRSRTNPERALNAFSLLFKGGLQDITLELVWAMMGLEAMFCKGNGNIKTQLYRKTAIVFEDYPGYRDRIEKMYEFRSKFLHGDLNIAPIDFWMQDEEEDEFQDVQHDAISFGVILLTATFQKMVRLNCTQFEGGIGRDRSRSGEE